MKICILTKYYPPRSTEGIPRTREIYARELVQQGHEVHVITSGHDGYVNKRNGVIVHEIPEVRDDEVRAHFQGFSAGERFNYALEYSYRVAHKIEALHEAHHFDLIDSPLWDIEGYITKLRNPSLKMVVRLETTSRQIREINEGTAGEFTIGDKFERNFLSLADALIFDSWCILKEIKKHYNVDFNRRKYRVVHHGIPDFDEDERPTIIEKKDDLLNILYVGRLEKRKGFDFVLDQIVGPVLKHRQNVIFHFVGKDCAMADGFLNENGKTYQEHAEEKFGDAIGKQIHFYGYVDDAEMKRIYASSDLVINFSRYESFGLLYLEAMRMKKPQMVFQNGATDEVFYGDKGSDIFEMEKAEPIIEKIIKYADTPSLLASKGELSYKHFKTHFTQHEMVNSSYQFFKEITSSRRKRVIHVMNALDQHDGVSNIAIDYADLTQELGYETILTGRHVNTEIKHKQLPIEDCNFRDDDLVLIHYWGFSDLVPRMEGLRGKKALLFHNVTDPTFFTPDQPEWLGTAGAYAQMKELDFFQSFATFSKFSQFPLRSYFGPNRSYRVLPPLIDQQQIINQPYDELLLKKLQKIDRQKILFVGRVVDHKKQIDLLHFLNAYKKNHSNCPQLYLIGAQNDSYTKEVCKAIETLDLSNDVILTGKVSQDELYTYYRACDLFLSMSEHEGFCLPLIDAMIFEIPVIGYAQEAVAETIGNPDAVFDKKNHPDLVQKIHTLLSDETQKVNLLEKQKERVESFGKENVKQKIQSFLEAIENG